MDPSFRARYEQRGKSLKLMGEDVGTLSRDELFAVIGYLLDAGDATLEERIARQQPLGSRPGQDAADLENPPKNDGLYEG